jgi:hypothetical protein
MDGRTGQKKRWIDVIDLLFRLFVDKAVLAVAVAVAVVADG